MDAPPSEPELKPERRPRYPGTHPRRFDQKYKERDAARHPEEIAKVLASGKTPAGSHRPICVREILDVLAPAPGEIGVDATLGAGGHALALLPRLHPGGRLIGLDVDGTELPRAEARIRGAGFGADAFVAVQANHASLAKVLAAQGIAAVDVILADLGCSSMQLDDPSRGFTHKRDGPLDLRMNQARGATAADLLARSDTDVDALAALLEDASDEPRARSIAAAIIAAREARPLLTTRQLAEAVDAGCLRGGAASGLGGEDTVRARARTFQALRVAVNDEFGTLEAFLRDAPWCLAPGGRVAILTFHSGEARRVKHAFRQGLREGLYSQVSRNVIRPSREEINANPRASSAKLRWARKG